MKTECKIKELSFDEAINMKNEILPMVIGYFKDCYEDVPHVFKMGLTHEQLFERECKNINKFISDVYTRSKCGVIIIMNNQHDELMGMSCMIGDETIAYISFIYLKEKFRGFGASKKLLQASFDWARKNKILTVNTTTFISNKIADRMLKSFGFEEYGVLLYKHT